MEVSITALIIPAFIAGILTFLAPCTLPLIPGYLGVISGVSQRKLENEELSMRLRTKIFLSGLLFVIGFSVIFVIFGALIGVAGSLLAESRVWLTRIGGVFVIFFGLVMLNVIKIPWLMSEHGVQPPKVFKQGSLMNSALLGAAFGFGWTPCIGPVLGSVLGLAASSANIASAAFLLAIFSLGMGLPFLAIALGIGHASERVNRLNKYTNVINKIGGVFFIALGLLLLMNNMNLLITWGTDFLEFLNLDGLLDFLYDYDGGL